MRINLKLTISTQWGEEVYVCGNIKELGAWNPEHALKLQCLNMSEWGIELDSDEEAVKYKYFIRFQDGSITWEFGGEREITGISEINAIINDSWRFSNAKENNLFTSPFINSFFRRDTKKSVKKKSLHEFVKFQLPVSRVDSNHSVGILGNTSSLGNWNHKKVKLLSDKEFPFWSIEFPLAEFEKGIVEYKYLIAKTDSKQIIHWEEGENRKLWISDDTHGARVHITQDELRGFDQENWRAAGFAIPVFSIRTKKSAGVGEFNDIKSLVDWAVSTDMKLIQVLPVNDTTATHSWIDSYPYAPISIHALHPIYGNMQTIGSLKNTSIQKEIEQEAKRLNALPSVDYNAVMKLKWKFYKQSFADNKDDFLKSKSFKSFYKKNKHWLPAYAAFSYLRDTYNTSDFLAWGDHSYMSEKQLTNFVSPKKPHYYDVALYYYIQYHLDLQLKEATEYARANKVVLKGDIAIGIIKGSVDAWRWPHLFNLDAQAGAPPDPFSDVGQNWGFPTYNWEAMEANDYEWWRSRLVKMAEYFDVFRIDHILGFFRIWQMPEHAVHALNGMFNPALPYTLSDLRSQGIDFDIERFCEPFIPAEYIHRVFKEDAEWVFQHLLEEKSPGIMQLKSRLQTQKQIKAYLDKLLGEGAIDEAFKKKLFKPLMALPCEVLFHQNFKDKDYYDPRILLHQTNSYAYLDDYQKAKLKELHDDFYYHRHNSFWREIAMKKLSMIKSATNMLICGEDLGMVPSSVPGVMADLQLLSLAVQRMTNDESEFWNPADLSYLYVTTTGSHDMSNLREWWHEDPRLSQLFYNNVLGFEGVAPKEMEAPIVEKTIQQHLESPAMFAIFPIQDLVAIGDEIKRPNCFEERINVPANIPHYWNYRFHMNIEDLIKKKSFNSKLAKMIEGSARV